MADLFTVGAFLTPLSYVNFGKENISLNQELIKDILIDKEDMASSNRSGYNAWQSELGLEKRYSSFHNLRNQIDLAVKASLPNIGYQKQEIESNFSCRSLWANVISDVGGFHLPHIHGNGKTIFSGVYYPTSGILPDGKPMFPDETFENEENVFGPKPVSPGDLILFDPAMAVKTQIVPFGTSKYPYYGGNIVVKPKQSKLVIFPNYLTHMVTPVIDRRTRISISFSFETL